MTYSKVSSSLLLPVLLLVAFSQLACSQQARPPTTAAETRAGAQPLGDAKIAAIVDVANQGEVQQAELARERAAQPEVLGFATAMIAGHGAAAREQSQLLEQRGIEPEFSAIAEGLMDRSMETQEALRGLRGPAFDRAYMQAQLDQHRDLLRMLDEQLIPSADDPRYRAYLEQLRAEVAQHLTHAERIRGNLTG